MEPFVIATETCYAAENIFLKVITDEGITGVGECSPFPMLVGETQDTCFMVGKNLAKISIGKDPSQIQERMNVFDQIIAYNTTIKSAFDMAFHDIAAQEKCLPLYQYLGGKKKTIQTEEKFEMLSMNEFMLFKEQNDLLKEQNKILKEVLKME